MSSSFSEFTQPGKKPVISSIFDFSAEALGEIRLWLEQNPPAVPITSVLGFSQFTAQAATVATAESTTSGTYTDLTTVGPTITGLSDGKYLLLWSVTVFGTVAGINYSAGPSIYAATPTVTATWQQSASSSVSSFQIATVKTGGNNTFKLQYASNGAATGTWSNRTLIALRYANP